MTEPRPIPPPAGSELRPRRTIRIAGWDVVEDSSGRIYLYQNWVSHFRYKLEGLFLAIGAGFCLTFGLAVLSNSPWVSNLQSLNGRIMAIASLAIGFFFCLPALRRLSGTFWLIADRTGITVGRSCLGFHETHCYAGKPHVGLVRTRHTRGHISYSLVICGTGELPGTPPSIRAYLWDVLLDRFHPHYFSLPGGRDELIAVKRELTRSTRGDWETVARAITRSAGERIDFSLYLDHSPPPESGARSRRSRSDGRIGSRGEPH